MNRRKLALVLLSVALILSPAVTTGCLKSASSKPVNPAPASADAQDIAKLKADVSQLQAKIASLPAPSATSDAQVATLKTDLTRLQSDIDKLQKQVDAMSKLQSDLTSIQAHLATIDERLVKLEKVPTTPSPTTEIATTRWTWEVSTNASNNVEVSTYVSPSRIEDAGTYKIRLTILNKATSINRDLRVGIVFTPTMGDIVYIDEKNTYLDTTQSPYYFWDMTVITRGADKYVRYLSILSEPITVPAAISATEPSSTQLMLEFNLKYK